MSKARSAVAQSIIDSPIAARVIASAADLALIIDLNGTILEVLLGEGFEPHPGWKQARRKSVEGFGHTRIREQGSSSCSPRRAPVGRRERERSIRKPKGSVRYRFVSAAVLVDEKTKSIVALGRDLRAIANMQQRMVTTQQAMDRDYGKMRQADTRYRVFFHVSSEAVLIADAVTQRVLEANPAAATMLGESAAALQGQTLKALFETASWPTVQNMIAAAEAGGKPSEAQASISWAKSNNR